MSRRMTSEEARAFAARWALVAEAEEEELRATPLERKFAQLAALMASARALGWETHTPEEIDEVRARWNRLAKVYRGA